MVSEMEAWRHRSVCEGEVKSDKKAVVSIPPVHDAEPSHLGQVDRPRVFLQPTAEGGIQTGEGDENSAVLGLAGLRLRRQLEVDLIGDGRLLAARVRVRRQQLVFEDDGVPLFCS